MTDTPRLSTERLELVPLRLEDAAEMVGVLADPALYRFIGGEPPPLEELDRRFRVYLGGSPRASDGEAWHNWVVRLGEGGPAVGHVQATTREHGRRAMIAWVIGTEWQGRGYATEAARGLVAWLELEGAREILATIHPDHVASARVAANAGLRRTDETEDGEIVWCRTIGQNAVDA